MNNYKLTSIKTGETLFAGFFKNFKSCLEEAVSRKITLHHINLKNKNLTNANLDDAILSCANFQGANLSGANISECYCKGANFKDTSLYNTCFAYSNLSQSDFTGAQFGATDMSGAIIDRAKFSTLSAFSIDFANTKQMHECTFTAQDGNISTLSNPPIVITGLRPSPIIMLDNDIYNGHRRIENNSKNRYVKIN